MQDPIWHSYPQLGARRELHLTPTGGTLFVDGAPLKISSSITDFLNGCDGSHQFDEIVPKNFSSDWEDLKFVTFISDAVAEGWLELDHEPSPRRTRVTGSRCAYFPPHMSIELTAGCNLRCDYCYRESDSSQLAHMPTAELLDLLERLWSAGLRTVELTGGEPTVHRDFSKILALCASKFDMVGVLSNGTRLTTSLATQFAEMGETLMYSVSLDASSPEMHDERRGVKGAWARTTKNIARLAQLGVAIRVSMVVDERNFDDIEPTLLLAQSLGARAFSYSPLLPLGRGRAVFTKDWKMEGTAVFAKESYLAERYKGFLGVLSDDAVCDLEGEDGCGAGYRTFALDPWGNVRPCATFGAQELVFGNLRAQTFEEVFGNPSVFAMKRVRTPSPSFCASCSNEEFCRYCILRGMHASIEQPTCAWRNQPAINALKNAGALS